VTRRPQVLATSGGFRPDRRTGMRPGPLVRRALELSGAQRPRVCLLSTALGDATEWVARGYAALPAVSVTASTRSVPT
jgi:hypothetical protein